jgi:hypothetical protein
MDDKALQEPRAGLEEACTWIDESATDDDISLGEIHAINQVLIFVLTVGVEERLVIPAKSALEKLETAYTRRRFGSNLRSVRDLENLAEAAALVTIFHERYEIPVTEMLDRAAKDLGLERKKIKAFRDDIGRGRASRRDVFTYNAYLAAHRNGGSLGR